MKKKKILITGGAGFIGFNLYLRLHQKNEIYILDFKKKIKGKPFKKNCKFIYGDISNKNTFNNLIKKKIKFDFIYHLAAETSTFLAEKEPTKCFQTNVLGTMNLFEFCTKLKPRNIIFASSMAIYGQNSFKTNENSVPQPISFYGLSKLNGEKILLNLKKKNVNVKIFRIFNAYGIFQDYNNPYQGMLSIYLTQIKRNSLVKVTGSLSRSRDFIYIDDIINAFVNSKIINYRSADIFNLGSGLETKVSSLLKILFKEINKDYKVNIEDKHSGDTNKSCANINLLNRIGWKSKISLKKGIKKIIKDLKLFDENNCTFNR